MSTDTDRAPNSDSVSRTYTAIRRSVHHVIRISKKELISCQTALLRSDSQSQNRLTDTRCWKSGTRLAALFRAKNSDADLSAFGFDLLIF
jgi:hypothetical protein